MATQSITQVELMERDVVPGDQEQPSRIQVVASSSLNNNTKILPRNRSWVVIVQLAGINFLNSFTNGLVTIGLPAIAASLHIRPSLLLWPSSAFNLTCGTCLLLAGTLADVIGPRSVALTGSFFVAIFTIATGSSRTGIQLILFRALSGLANALTLPSAISIVSTSIESGKRRNIGFATLGLAMPLGFSCGLVLGGVLVSGPGWRFGFYIGGAASFLLLLAGIWALPKTTRPETEMTIWKRLQSEIDWIGAGIASATLGLLSYLLADLSANLNNIKRTSNIIMLVLVVLLLPVFVVWTQQRERRRKSVLIPNSLWKKRSFTSICVMVLLSNAVVNAMELFSSLFFQEVQHQSALQASLRILPNMMIGIVINFLTGTFVNKVPVIYAVLISCGLSAVAPLLMAIINPRWPYWYDAFFAQLLSPLAVDVLFTVGILVVSNVFPERTQALAGAVFNTAAQLGTSLGLATTAVISATVTRDSGFTHLASPKALLEGYRAAFWTLFAWMATACVVGVFGLRKLGKIGQKRE